MDIIIGILSGMVVYIVGVKAMDVVRYFKDDWMHLLKPTRRAKPIKLGTLKVKVTAVSHWPSDRSLTFDGQHFVESGRNCGKTGIVDTKNVT